MHQTGAPTAKHTFNSYTGSANGAHFLIDKAGKIYQTAQTNKLTYHVGKARSRCITTKVCLKTDLSAANAIYLKKGLSYSLRVKNLHKFEKTKSYPDRYPMNHDSVGIEIVGAYVKSSQSYEAVNIQQNISLKWLVTELSSHLSLQADDVYRHPEVSYKKASEAKSAQW